MGRRGANGRESGRERRERAGKKDRETWRKRSRKRRGEIEREREKDKEAKRIDREEK